MSKSTARIDRQRLVSPLAIAGFGTAVAVGLALMYPRGTLEERLLGSEGRDGLTIAYLEAWLRIEPNNDDLLFQLARVYARQQRFEDAEKPLARLRVSHTGEMPRRAFLIQLDIMEQRAYALAPEDPERAQWLGKVTRLLNEALDMSWSAPQLEVLAAKVRALNDGALAAHYYKRLATIEPSRATYWLAKAIEVQIGSGRYHEAAEASFAAQDAANAVDDKRRYFLAGLRALQAGNLLQEAMEAARTHIGALEADVQTLRFLTRLSLAAGRPDLAANYGSLLAKASARQRGSMSYQSWGREKFHGVRIVRVAAANGTGDAAAAAAEDDELAYGALVGNGRLREAQALAQAAIRQDPTSIAWRRRLAQVALWNSDVRVALDTHLWLAKTQGDEESWRQVLKLAPGVPDDQALLAALRHQIDRTPDGAGAGRRWLEDVDNVVAVYERLAAPGSGLQFLMERARGNRRRPLLERHAALAERSGDEKLALQTWQTLDREYGPSRAYAMKIALQLYAQTRFEEALAAMERGKRAPTGKDAGDERFWRFYMRLGQISQQREVVVEASRKLLVQGVQTPSDLAMMVDLFDATPMDAARLAELAYQRTGQVRPLEQALYYYTRAHAYARIGVLLDQLTPEQLAVAEQSPGFLLARSQYWKQAGKPERAVEDVRSAVELVPDNREARIAWLWLMIERGSTAELGRALRVLGASPASDVDMQGALAAGYLRLGDARAALRHLRLCAHARRHDPLWQLSFADALELEGQVDAAWQLRRKVWLALRAQQEKQDVPLTPEQREALRARMVALVDQFEGGDASRRVLVELLRQDRESQARQAEQPTSELGDLTMLPPRTAVSLRRDARHFSAAAHQAALAWARAHDEYPLERAWLERQYLRKISSPDYAEVAIALEEHDIAELNRVLDDLPDRRPPESAGGNAQPAGLAETQTDLFNRQELLPDNDSIHAALQDSMLSSAQAITPAFRSVHASGLTINELSLGAGIRLNPNHSLELRYVDRIQDGDDNVLPNVPRHDREVLGVYRHQATAHTETVRFGYRDALDRFVTIRLEGTLTPIRPLNLSYALGYNQEATESTSLQVGGVKDMAAVAASYWLDPHYFVGGRFEYDRFHGQDRTFLGTGAVFSVEGGYKFRLTYPDYMVRAVVTHGHYDPSGTAGPLLQKLVPGGAPATARQFMPESFTQVAVLFSFGGTIPTGYTRAWRPFLSVGPVYDTRSHLGVQVGGGIAGSVFGGDQLAFYISHSSASSSRSTPVTEYGVRYRWLF